MANFLRMPRDVKVSPTEGWGFWNLMVWPWLFFTWCAVRSALFSGRDSGAGTVLVTVHVYVGAVAMVRSRRRGILPAGREN